MSKVVEMLKNGADVNLADGVKTPFKVACYKGNLDVVKELIQTGAFVYLANDSIAPLKVVVMRDIEHNNYNDNKWGQCKYMQ